MTAHYDIAICGAGLVGTTLALALLAKTDKKVLLFDSKVPGALSAKAPLDTRTLALNTFSQQLLADLGLWADLHTSAEAIQRIQISERGSFAKAFLTAEDLSEDALGYVIEIDDLQASLQEKLNQAHDRLCFLAATHLTDFKQQEPHVHLNLLHKNVPQNVTCDWLIAADSSQSFIRQQLKIPTTQRDYQQTAIVSVIQLEKSAGNQAFERFLKDGVLALLPLTHNRCGAVWVSAHKPAQALLALNDADYMAALQQQFGQQLGSFVKIGPRQHYPLHLVLANKVMTGQIMIIGNAAHTLNPIGAQGLNLGLHDVACLLQFFKQELTQEGLEEKLLSRNQQLAQLSDATARLYAIDCCPINIARRLSLFSLEHCGPLKKHFTRRMMGY